MFPSWSPRIILIIFAVFARQFIAGIEADAMQLEEIERFDLLRYLGGLLCCSHRKILQLSGIIVKYISDIYLSPCNKILVFCCACFASLNLLMSMEGVLKHLKLCCQGNVFVAPMRRTCFLAIESLFVVGCCPFS